MPQDPQNVLEQLAQLVAKFTQRGGEPMPTNQQDPTQEPITVDPETFSAMQTQLAELKQTVDQLSQERDTYAQRLQASETKLAEEVTARQLVEMKSHVETFSHLALPVELAEDAPEGSQTAQQHFAWLHNADQAEGKPHWAFFNSILRAADAALEEASVFTELGTTHSEQLTEDEKLHRAASAYAKENQVDYFTALKAVTSQPLPAA